jgi:hypothetical protein
MNAWRPPFETAPAAAISSTPDKTEKIERLTQIDRIYR